VPCFRFSAAQENLADTLREDLDRLCADVRTQLDKNKNELCDEMRKAAESVCGRLEDRQVWNQRVQTDEIVNKVTEVIVQLFVSGGGVLPLENSTGKQALNVPAAFRMLQKTLQSGCMPTTCPVLALPFDSTADSKPLEVVPCGHTISFLACKILNLLNANDGSGHTCPVCSMAVIKVAVSEDMVTRTSTVRNLKSLLLLPPIIEPSELVEDDNCRRELGVGGEGRVYPMLWKASHLNIGDKGLPVAIKYQSILPGTRQRLIEKLSLHQLAMLSAPGIVRVFGHVYDRQGVQPVLGTVMERLHASLLELVSAAMENGGKERVRALSDNQIADVALAIARSLRAMHCDLRIWHLDVTPANIMFTRSGEPRLIDFGLSRRAETQMTHITVNGAFTGTLGYAAPEVAASGPVASGITRRHVRANCDVYSLGQCCVFMALGRLLDGAAPPQLFKAQKAAWAGEGKDAVDGELLKLIDKMRSNKPEERPMIEEVVRRMQVIVERLGPGDPLTCSSASMAQGSDATVKISIAAAAECAFETAFFLVPASECIDRCQALKVHPQHLLRHPA
jgi:serine/threonine protein kinase